MQVSHDEFRSFATHLSAAVDKVKEASSHVDNELAVIDWCITQNIDRAHTLISQISSYAAERFDIGGTASFIAPDYMANLTISGTSLLTQRNHVCATGDCS